MVSGVKLGVFSLAVFFHCSLSLTSTENRIKSAVFLSPKFVMKPGSVVNQYYHNVNFPRGHIGLKSLHAEVVDDYGNPVPLRDTYLHHWVIMKYHQPQNSSDIIYVRNSGICQKRVLGQYYGLGSETRKTSTYVPDPYGIEVGNPWRIPQGYEERWMLNVHAIDTRGVVDRLGCTECRCDLYNVTNDEYGRPLLPGYAGGLYCCYDQTRCKVKDDFKIHNRVLYMRYTVKWVEWDDSVLPVDIYILDVTDELHKLSDGSEKHNCLVEYEVQRCDGSNLEDYQCIDTKRAMLSMPTDGHVIYGVAHQHSGGVGAALYGENGRLLCSSMPTYGEGKEPGNESGYIVGMSTCYPTPGSVWISHGENLVFESNYSATMRHTGVMGLFYLLVARPSSRQAVLSNQAVLPNTVVNHEMDISLNPMLMVAVVGIAIVIMMGVAYLINRPARDNEGYESLVI